MEKTTIAKHVSRAIVLALLLLLASLSRNNHFSQNKQNTSGGMVSITGIYCASYSNFYTRNKK